jgi:hypothetical protein
VVPDLDGPVGGARDEDALVERVPLDAVHGHVVPLVVLEVLPGVGLAALVDVSLLGAHDEEVLLGLVEVEAAAAGEAGEGGLLRVVLDVVDELELHHGLHLELVLAHDPVRHASVGRDGEEVELLRVDC